MQLGEFLKLLPTMSFLLNMFISTMVVVWSGGWWEWAGTSNYWFVDHVFSLSPSLVAFRMKSSNRNRNTNYACVNLRNLENDCFLCITETYFVVHPKKEKRNLFCKKGHGIDFTWSLFWKCFGNINKQVETLLKYISILFLFFGSAVIKTRECVLCSTLSCY